MVVTMRACLVAALTTLVLIPSGARTQGQEPAPAALRVVEDGAEFAVITGDTVGITRRTRVFAVEEVDPERDSLTWKVSDLETGEDARGRGEEGDLLVLDEECRLMLYDVKLREGSDDPVASLLLMCAGE